MSNRTHQKYRPSKFTPRDYQEHVFDLVFEGLEQHNSVLYGLPTGTGKTVVFCMISERLLENPSNKVLVLAHRTELIMSAYNKIKKHCDLDEWQIGAEKGSWYAPFTARVVVGSIASLDGNRLKEVCKRYGFTHCIYDEAHHATAPGSIKIFKELGVKEGKCKLIGCTATWLRNDKTQLYAIEPDGNTVTVEDKTSKEQRPVNPEDVVFDKFLCNYTVEWAWREGYLVEILDYTANFGADLSKVKLTKGAKTKEYSEQDLAKLLENDAERDDALIDVWAQKAGDRPTVAFCTSVVHAYQMAEAWRAKGFKALAVSGETEENERIKAFEDFVNGEIQILCNYGVYTEGTDLPMISCIVHARPVKWWGLYFQMTGRGLRPLPGVIEHLNTAEERKAAIAASAKKNCIVIKAADIDSRAGDICTPPTMVGIPVDFDTESLPLIQVKDKIDEFDKEKKEGRILVERPKTYGLLVATLEKTDRLKASYGPSADKWAVNDKGFRLMNGLPVGKGYSVELVQINANQMKLVVSVGKQELYSKIGKPIDGEKTTFRDYLEKAELYAQSVVDQHYQEYREKEKAGKTGKSKGTLAILTQKQINVLCRNGHKRNEIDCMTTGHARKLIRAYMDAYKAKLESGEIASSTVVAQRVEHAEVDHHYYADEASPFDEGY